MSRPASRNRNARPSSRTLRPRKKLAARACNCPRCLFLKPEELRALAIRKES